MRIYSPTKLCDGESDGEFLAIFGCCISSEPRAAHVVVVTGSIARSAARPYLSYSEADFEVFFRPAGATRCTNGSEIWRPRQTSPQSV